VSAAARQASVETSYGYVATPLPYVVRLYFGPGCSFLTNTDTCSTCSGTMVTRGLVLTAGHCVYSNPVDGMPENGFTGYYGISNYWVVPGNDETNGTPTAPYGYWSVRNMWTTPTYTGKSSIGSDWGVIEVSPNAQGQFPGDVVGAAKAQWDDTIPLHSTVYLTGYPASGLFRQPTYDHGNKQYFCSESWDQAQDSSSLYGSSWAMLFQPCQMNGGASGGPVFYDDPSTGWVIVGVNNRGKSTSSVPNDPKAYGRAMISFWLDDAFGSFWNAVVAQVNAGR
jgi:V8-like Glu-specific endopeptidase